jgi:cobalt/nickel transport system permease protein
MALTEPFAAGSTLLHRLDPRAKLVAAVVWSVALAGLSDVRVLLVGLVVAVVLLVAARLDPARLLRRLLLVNVFVVFLWLVLPWSVDGRTVASWGPIVVTHEGMLLALRLTLRCNAIVGAWIALLGTSRLTAVAQALRALHVPEKLVLILFFCARYIQLIHDEYARMAAAIRLRAFTPRTTRHTYRTVANLVGMLLVRGHDRAGRVRDAMVCRGFEGRLHTLGGQRLCARDCVAAAALAAVTVALVMMEWLTTG